MEKLILTSLGAAFSLGVAAATIAFYFLVFFRPQFFAPDPNPYATRELTWRDWAFFLAVMAGTGACVHGGALYALAWVPHSWKITDDDGEVRWFAEGVADLLGGLAAFVLPSAASGLAVRVVKAERLASRLKEELSR